MDLWILGTLAGLVATGAMTLLELVARSRWGLAGLLDWQINQESLARLLKRPAKDLVLAGLAFHFVHGLLGGIVLALLLPLLPPAWPVWGLGVGFGLVLFLLTLLAFQPITGRALGSQPRDFAAVVVALATHLAYGAVLGLLLT